MKICGKCKAEKPFFEFGKKGNGYQSYCVPCRRIAQKEWLEADPERKKKAVQRAKKWSINNPEKRKEHRKKYIEKYPERISKQRLEQRLKVYGLTIQQYQSMLHNQNNCCAICKKEKKLWIDHNHSTGKVRALLCPSCNSIVGYLETYKEIICVAERYIKDFE